MNPVADVGLGVAALVVAAALVLYPPLPRPKPEPPAPVEDAAPVVLPVPPQARAEPDAPRAKEQRGIDRIGRTVDEARREVIEIKEAIRLQQAVKAMPDESGGGEP